MAQVCFSPIPSENGLLESGFIGNYTDVSFLSPLSTQPKQGGMYLFMYLFMYACIYLSTYNGNQKTLKSLPWLCFVNTAQILLSGAPLTCSLGHSLIIIIIL